MFWVRLRSSIILMIFTISLLLIGGNVLFGAILVISLIGLTELYKIVNINKSVLGAVGYLGCILFNFIILSKEEYIIPFIIGFLLVLLMAYVFQFPKYQIEHVTVAFFGLFYVAIMLSYVYQVRMLNGGAFLVWLIFIGAWGSDTCAYCVGMTLGKHKFLPILSPKKSLEGCIGGVVGAALLGFLYAIILNMNNITIVNSYNFAIICGASSIISQLGDLAASAIKRNHNIKDYGTLIPGHGGILDRFDSIIFVAPIVFYLSELL